MVRLSTSLLLGSCCPLALALTHQLLVGTFGTPYIYSVAFDDAARTLTLASNTTVSVGSSWISLSHDKKALYGNAFVDGGNSQYVSYPIADDLSIGPATTVESKGACAERSIFVAQAPTPPYNVYGQPFGACGTVMSTTSEGLLSESVQEYNYLSSAGVHGVTFSPSGSFMYSFDDSGNAIWVHAVDNSTGQLSFVANVSAPIEKADPRHGAVHPSGNFLYAVHEGSNEVGVYEIDQTTGIPTYANASFPLIPAGLNTTDYWSDEVAISHSAKYLWASSRARSADNTGYISLLSLNADGSVAKQNFLTPTSTSGGSANAVAASPFGDAYVALTDSSVGFVEIWEMGANGAAAGVVAHLDLKDGGCCGNAVWLT